MVELRREASGAPGLEPILRIEGLSKRFPVRRGWVETLRHPTRVRYESALESVTLAVREGEVFGLLGQNGAGKTTLFKILASLVLPDEGTVTIAGHDLRRNPERIRALLTPVIPNERSLYWRLPARENLRLYATLHGMAPGDASRRIDELLALVSLEEAGDRQVGLFSSGMKQRLLVARALLAWPRILLLDEPTRSLDPVGARDFRTFLREEVARRQNCTVLLATHDHHEVSDLCTRVGILERGRLRAVGPTGSLLRDLQVHRYHLWTRMPEAPALREKAVAWGAERIEVHAPDDEGWSRVAFDLPEGSDRAARLLSELAAAGLAISRFEKVELPLAELIERATHEPAPPGSAEPAAPPVREAT